MARPSDIIVRVRHQQDGDTVTWRFFVMWALFRVLAEVEDWHFLAAFYEVAAFGASVALVVSIVRAHRTDKADREDEQETERWEADKKAGR